MKRELGFTLLEAIITVSLLGLLAGFGMPRLDHWLRSQHSLTVSRILEDAMRQARMQAINSGDFVTVCGSTDAATCDGNWTANIIIFDDNELDARISANNRLLARPTPPAGGTILWRGFGSTRYVRFHPSGRTWYQNGRLTYCPQDRDARFARQVVVSVTGRVTVARDRDGNGIREGANGTDLQC